MATDLGPQIWRLMDDERGENQAERPVGRRLRRSIAPGRFVLFYSILEPSLLFCFDLSCLVLEFVLIASHQSNERSGAIIVPIVREQHFSSDAPIISWLGGHCLPSDDGDSSLSDDDDRRPPNKRCSATKKSNLRIWQRIAFDGLFPSARARC